MAAFNPNRLIVARKRRGLTKTTLAERARISTRMLNEYESDRGVREPPEETLERIAEALDFPVGFFYGSDLEEPALQGATFRSLSTLSARQRDQAFGSAAFALSLSRWIGQHFKLPEPDIPRIQDLSPESAAETVRDYWELGERPVRNMVHLLEHRGVRVFSLAEECAEVDAFSFWNQGVPYVFLNTWKSAERSRMDAAHELGHLVLHWGFETSHTREAEKEAQVFGSAFLMPRGSVLADAPRHPQLSHLVEAKHHWNVSVAALAHRMFKLGLLTEWEYRMLFIQIGEAGFRKAEPEEGAREKSQVLEKVLQMSRATGQSKADIAAGLNIPIDEINKVVFGLVLIQMSGRDSRSEPESRAELRLV